MNAKFVTPRCCQEVQSHVTVYLQYRFDPERLEPVYDEPPTWHTRGWDIGWEWPRSSPAKFCPHCGTAVPEIVKVDRSNRKVYTPDDNYCGTCKKRNRECACLPPEFEWGPKS